MTIDNYYEYQLAHGNWMKNGTGSAVSEVIAICLMTPISVFILKIIKVIIILNYKFNLDAIRSTTREWLIAFLIEFIVIVGLLLSAVTCHYVVDYLITIGCALILLTMMVSASLYYFGFDNDQKKTLDFRLTRMTSSIITSCRACFLILAVICILGVDFPLFPRRHAKTELFGTSLMDVGVGGFIVSNAIVSPEARQTPTKKAWYSGVFPLLALGFLRLSVIKAIGYHENPSEYGTHWNFFFTLTAVKVASTFIFSGTTMGTKGALPVTCLAILIMSSYQLSLTKYGLSEFIVEPEMSTPVNDMIKLLNNNRSGIFSCVGFLGLYFIGTAIGRTLFVQKKNTSLWQIIKLSGQLFIAVAVMLAILFPVMSRHVQPPSRRLANLTYVISVVAIVNSTFLLFLILEVCLNIFTLKIKWMSSSSSIILDAVNSHGLAVFLLANVLTGLINLSVATIYSSTLTAIFILTFYSIVITFLPTLWKRKQITTKIW